MRKAGEWLLVVLAGLTILAMVLISIYSSNRGGLIGFFITKHSWIYWTISLLLSVYYGFRGWLYEEYDPYIKPSTDKSAKPLEGWQKKVVLNIHGAIYNFVCGMAGFLALKAIHTIVSRADLLKVETGTACVLGILAFIAILGCSGSLPRIFWRHGPVK